MKKLLIALAACGLIACNNDNGRYVYIDETDPHAVFDTKTGIIYLWSYRYDTAGNKHEAGHVYDPVNRTFTSHWPEKTKPDDMD